ncbi:hypothetical protein CONPUDRAFT_145017 [Coniophora puteana RWD-64-598 SS2]|uniref:BTB domain-containing protein n=1 Tax=Coniophora puteana (strain RWD-64-598) TaxID=741705 RepID=A0A5M3ML15_CONPW|nr:uncharacterized protein CONPUDRAFT_145017 [Coniophora puteana RWD-64-598 SS2]EIW79922.1 hypothetical protein CONPUDRAFT_145017 [Coniophora puteana RWD-64-598 SS2]
MSSENYMADEDWTRTKRSTPWYDDGNIVLVSANSSALFRVHRGILCSYSTIFKDMFTASHEGEEVIDGCPVVHMHDTEDDLKHVLMAMYSRSYFPSGAKSAPVTVIAAFLRLGKKYEISDLYDEAQAHLEIDLPDNFEAYVTSQSSPWKITSVPNTSHDVAIAVANIVREAGLLSMLPAALHMCMDCCTMEEIFAGLRDENGNVGRTLSLENQQACALAIQPYHELTGQTFAFVQTSLSTCTSRTTCQRAKQAFLAENFFPSPKLTPLADCDEEFLEALCPACATDARSLHRDSRKEAWRRLPGIFGLPDWTELVEKELS